MSGNLSLFLGDYEILPLHGERSLRFNGETSQDLCGSLRTSAFSALKLIFKRRERRDYFVLNVSKTISGVTPKRTGMMLVPIPVVTNR